MKQLFFLTTIILTCFIIVSCSKDNAIVNQEIPVHVQHYDRNADFAIRSPQELLKFRNDNVYPFNKLSETTFKTLLYSMSFNTTGNFYSFSNTGNLHQELNEPKGILKFYELVYGEKTDVQYQNGTRIKATFANPLLKPACVPVVFPGAAYPTNNTCNCCTTCTECSRECRSTC